METAVAPDPNAAPTTGPVDIDARAAQMAIQIVEGHFESATGSHLHWMYRELSKHMHREFNLAAREQALEQQPASNPSSGPRRRQRRVNRGGQNTGVEEKPPPSTSSDA